MNSLFDELGMSEETATERLARELAEADINLINSLRGVREEKGLTQADLGNLMGVSQATVSDFESGSSEPRLSTVRRYAHALQVIVTHEVRAVDLNATGFTWMTTHSVSSASRAPMDLASYRVNKGKRADFVLGA